MWEHGKPIILDENGNCAICGEPVITETLRKIAKKQQEALKIIEENDFIFTDIGKEPGNWMHLAFTLYTEICEIDVWARNALGIELGEDLA